MYLYPDWTLPIGHMPQGIFTKSTLGGIKGVVILLLTDLQRTELQCAAKCTFDAVNYCGSCIGYIFDPTVEICHIVQKLDANDDNIGSGYFNRLDKIIIVKNRKLNKFD